ncbi:MAG: 4Fe-4S binding protein [Oscillospiraceae bacterium]|nr:4Fe-4S binding protein [Oscillospiraceae bacterium]
MIINKTLCVNCRKCVPFCPVGAIEVHDRIVQINADECVECGVCFRSAQCPRGAIEMNELDEIRMNRKIMSDPSAISAKTKIGGRGTVEMKTNDITGRFREGFAGVGVEMGRPGVGTRLRDVETVAMALTAIGVSWEDDNPITALMSDQSTGKFRDELLNEKVLSGILEFTVPSEKLPQVLETLRSVESRIDTVFSLGVISKLGDQLEDPNLDTLLALGYQPYPNLKVNIGLGKPLFDFAAADGAPAGGC